MEWIEIQNSHAMSAYGYDPKLYTLGIQSGGRQYLYLNVPTEVHEQFVRAESKGKFWLSAIKPKYQCRRDDGADVSVPAPKPASKPAAAETPAQTAEVLSLAISFESNGQVPTLPFAAMVDRLKQQMESHFAATVIEIDDLAKLATTLTVTDEASFTTAAELGKQLAAKRKYITELMKPTKQAIDSVKAVVLDKEKELLVSARAGEDRLSRICTEYRTAEQRRAREAQEAERRRLLKEAEDKRIREAEQAEAAGKTRLADALLSTPVTAPKVEVKADVPKIAGVTARKNWKWRVTDLSKVPDEFWTLDEVAIGQRVRADKDKTSIPGIEAYPEDTTNF